MPLYEYECNECGRRTEKIQKFSDSPLTECPHCGGRIERTLTAPAVQFKGGGWYKDLYSSAKPSNGSKSGSEASKPAESSSTTASSNGSSAAPSAPSPAPATASKD